MVRWKGRGEESGQVKHFYYVQVVEDEQEEELDGQQELRVAIGGVELVGLYM